MHREEHLGVLIERVVVALRHELREEAPVSRWQLGRRPVRPVLDDQLAPGVQALAELDHVVDVFLILPGVPQEVRGRDVTSSNWLADVSANGVTRSQCGAMKV